MQVDPIKSMMQAPGSKRLKLKHHQLLSNCGFKCKVRHYPKGAGTYPAKVVLASPWDVRVLSLEYTAESRDHSAMLEFEVRRCRLTL